MNPLVLLLLVLLSALPAFADRTFDRNQAARRLYKQGKYDEALKIFEDALLENPDDSRLKMNRGSTRYQLGNFQEAEQDFLGALSEKDKKVLADLHYNLGNSLYRQGEQLMTGGGQGALEKFKGALENYIKSLDMRPDDRDAKWNLQLAQQRIEQLRNQQQNQQRNQDKNKDDKQEGDKDRRQDQDGDDRNKDGQEQQDKDNQDQSQDQKDKKDEQNPRPKPDPEKDMKKDQARQIIEQFADDDDDLNKPRRKTGGTRNPEKDW